MAVTLYLFNQPALQIAAHQALTVATMMLLSYDTDTFESAAMYRVEVGSEFMLLTSSILLAQFMDTSYNQE